MKNNKIIIKNGDVKSMENKKLSKVASQRVEKNLKVLKLLKENNINMSLEEKRIILDEYTGWGGLRDAIYTLSVYKQLKSYLSDDRINDLKKTTRSAYYTPELLVKFIWSTLGVIGFKGGKILEPAVGHGVFVKNIPQSISNNSTIDAVEMDLLTCRILIQKHPKIKLTATCFENIYFNQEKYDLIVANPPYSSQIVEDIYYKDLSHLAIHHFFVAKCARLLKDNGIIAMVLPLFFLDNTRDHARDIISKDGVNMLMAYRLPDNIFANAKISVDIVFLTKAKTNIPWTKSKSCKIGNHRKPMNEYFINNPDNTLGKLEVVPMYNRKGITCTSNDNLRDQLKEVYLNLKDKSRK
ncbi:N-6 DNA methylase [Rickettsiaceae bacterium]|nr:N-6 DNA methylase [Rickettsiaceae bacterium]